MSFDFVSFLNAAVQAGTPLLFATLGENVSQKSGHLNLGVEGMMLMGAVIGFRVGLVTKNPMLAVIGALLAGAAGSLIYAFLTVTLRANQEVSGLSLTIFGTGFSSFVGQKLMGEVCPEPVKAFFKPFVMPLLGRIPFVGPILFEQDIFVYAGYIAAFIMGFYIYHTKMGLNLRVVGESPAAADAAGINVALYKYGHILLGGALCGLGGGYLSLVYVPAWQENVTSGRGWIAVALVIFTSWNAFKVPLGAYVFGGLDIIGFRLQKFDFKISQYFIDMVPYVVTIIILVISSVKKLKENAPPKGLGTPYFREER